MPSDSSASAYRPSVLITGGTGFIGRAVIEALHQQGYPVIVLTRDPMQAARKLFHQAIPITTLTQIPATQPIGIVINLAGEPLAAARWTPERKTLFRQSRMDTTTQLVQWLREREQRPTLLLSGSAIGYYGPQVGSEPLDEQGAIVDSFSHRLCHDWEQSALAATELGIRVVLLRTGIVLGNDGGSLPEMKRSLIAKIALHFGSGSQWMSWIHRDDYVALLLWLIDQPNLSGAINMTAPEPVTQREFVATLKRIHRALLQLSMPAPIARLLLGEMADALLLTGQRVVPAQALAAGFKFRYPTLSGALEQLH